MKFSKNSQRFDTQPFFVMNKYKKLMELIFKAREEFKTGNIPKVENLDAVEKQKPFVLWSDFKICIETIIKEQNFKGFPLLLPSERGRMTRSRATYEYASSDFSSLVKCYFLKFGNYIDILVFNLGNRLAPWPQQLRLCDDCFNFENNKSNKERKTSLHKLTKERFGPVPLLEDERERIEAEYVTLLVNVATI